MNWPPPKSTHERIRPPARTRSLERNDHPRLAQEQLQRQRERLPGNTYPPPPGQAPVRDSKDADDSVIVFKAEAWVDFIAALRRGEFPVRGLAFSGQASDRLFHAVIRNFSYSAWTSHGGR
ncbi:DUF397 domain-containing protein [Streptomyces sp. MNU76]|nr:DUF397 domain-containing protein [Streptomyces sp. MNU76]